MKLLLCILLLPLLGYSQILSEQFSSAVPSAAIWSSTSSSWELNHNYGAGNAYSGSYCARLASASSGNGKYVYIKINVTSGNIYNLSFYSKRFCNITVNTNETADQTSLLSTTTFNTPGCNNTWYNSSVNYTATYTGVMYWQILCNTVYGGPTSIYLDDVVITETSSLPVDLLYFRVKNTTRGNLVEWKTGSETNNYYFTLFKSSDLITWETLDLILGNGTTPFPVYYPYLDENISYGINYYQLRQTDYNGVFKNYDIISINNQAKSPQYVRTTNILGQDVASDYTGMVIEIYNNGDRIKTINK